MKRKTINVSIDNSALREKILKSMVASFKMEGINISSDDATAILKKVSLNLNIEATELELNLEISIPINKSKNYSKREEKL